jgi:hypothetical protein
MAASGSSSNSSNSSNSSYSSSASSAEGAAGQGLAETNYRTLELLATIYGGNGENRTDKWKLMEHLYDWDNTPFLWGAIEGKGVKGKKVRKKPRYYLYASSTDWAPTPEQFNRAVEFILNGIRNGFLQDKDSAKILKRLLIDQIRTAIANAEGNMEHREETIKDINEYKHPKWNKTMSMLTAKTDEKTGRYVRDEHGKHGAYSHQTAVGRTYTKMESYRFSLLQVSTKVFDAGNELEKV